jgi:histidyl-tRNA synthetase
MQNLTTQPPKGTVDWWPEEFRIRKYIFDTWRSVCEEYGYEEYLTPLVEYADVYRAKSGEDVGGKELTAFTDRGGRELAIRPEMTPSVTRMVAERYNGLPKPIRLFSIANFFRNEKPQKGRNREFWQLNFDVFGSDSLNADIEILEMAINIMRRFGATERDFVVYINNRQLIQSFITQFLKIPVENIVPATRLIDKFAKLSQADFLAELKKLGAQIENESLLVNFMRMDEAAFDDVRTNYMPSWEGFAEFKRIADFFDNSEYKNYGRYNPAMVRGFDYYDGMVFEVFPLDDMGVAEGRSLFGGGRYNGLAGIFGRDSFPAVGCAPGDETTRIFLEAKGLLPQDLTERKGIYFPRIDEQLPEVEYAKLAAKLRATGERVVSGLEYEKLGKAIGTADKVGAQKVVIFGTQELAAGEYGLKDLATGAQEQVKI